MDLSCHFVFPPAMAFLLMLLPCQLPFLGSVILPGCEFTRSPFPSHVYLNLVVKVVLILFEFSQIFRNLITGMHYGMYIVIAGILHLWEASSKIVGSPGFSKNYRQLQVLEAVVNGALRDKLFPSFLVLCPFMQIMATYASVKFHDGMPATYLIFVVLLSVEGVILNGLYSTAAAVIYRKSDAYLKAAKGVVLIKLDKKVLKSYTPLRVRFGSNFMDRLTPLVLQEFIAMQTINLLLLT